MMKKYKFFETHPFDVTGIIHAGAHRGEEVVEYAEAGVKKVIWIEANPDVFRELHQNLHNNRHLDITSVTVLRATSSKSNDIVPFHIIYGGDAGVMVGNKGMSSLLSPSSPDYKNNHRATINVRTIALDDIFADPRVKQKDYQLLNMDVQGAELLTLQGATTVLPGIKYISTEVTWDNPGYHNGVMQSELTEYLKQFGFTCVETIEMAPGWGDALYVKNELA